MKDILVFSHMMKTAGTALSKEIIQHYGPKVHIVPGGLRLNHTYYTSEKLANDILKKNHQLKVLIGHPLRPHIDFNQANYNLRWFTFLRKPSERYLSHFLHQYKWTKNFQQRRYRSMKEVNIINWEKIDNFANYQCRFICGEANADKAVEVLEEKFEWVGITEDYKRAIQSFKSHFDLNNMYTKQGLTNRSLANDNLKKDTVRRHWDFIQEMNKEDDKLYDYVLKRVWPKCLIENSNDSRVSTTEFRRFLNMLRFQIDRQLKFQTADLNVRNLKRFYNRWYR